MRLLTAYDGENYNPNIVSLIHDYVPIYSISIENDIREEGQASGLSHWFRNTMGRGFSFSDIDYLVTNTDLNKSILIEEKIGKSGLSALGYGQLISYKELITDVIKKPNFLLFIFSIEDANLDSRVKYSICRESSFNGNNLTDRSLKQSTLKELADNIINALS